MLSNPTRTPSSGVRVGSAFKQARGAADDGRDRSPLKRHSMADATEETAPMRMGECPFCERSVLVYEEPPRCPLCACPLDEERMRPFSFPVEDAAPDG